MVAEMKTLTRVLLIAVAVIVWTTSASAGPGINITTEADWGSAIGTTVNPLTAADWGTLDPAFKASMANGEPYTFIESTLWASGGGMYYPDGGSGISLPSGMGMGWGQNDGPPLSEGYYIAGWKYTYGEDPNLTNQQLLFDVNPPVVSPATGAVIVTLGIGLQDVNGKERSWTYLCVAPPPGPGVLVRNMMNWVQVNVAPANLGGAPDALHDLVPPPPGGWPGPLPMGPWDLAAYADNGFDPTQCVSIVGIENGKVPANGAINCPTPGSPYNRNQFNWWGALLVTPEPGTLSLLALGGLALIRRRRTA